MRTKDKILIVMGVDDETLKKVFVVGPKKALVVPGTLVKETLTAWAINNAARFGNQGVVAESTVRAMFSTIVQTLEHNGKLIPEHINVFSPEAQRAVWESVTPVEERTEEAFAEYYTCHAVSWVMDNLPDYHLVVKTGVDLIKKALRYAPGFQKVMGEVGAGVDSNSSINNELLGSMLAVVQLLNPINTDELLTEVIEALIDATPNGEAKAAINDDDRQRMAKASIARFLGLFSENMFALTGAPRATLALLEKGEIQIYEPDTSDPA